MYYTMCDRNRGQNIPLSPPLPPPFFPCPLPFLPLEVVVVVVAVVVVVVVVVLFRWYYRTVVAEPLYNVNKNKISL